MVIVLVINKTHSIVHGVFARCFDGVFGLFARSDPRWDPCILAPIRADPGTFSVAGIRIRANFGARIRSHLPAGPPGALRKYKEAWDAQNVRGRAGYRPPAPPRSLEVYTENRRNFLRKSEHALT